MAKMLSDDELATLREGLPTWPAPFGEIAQRLLERYDVDRRLYRMATEPPRPNSVYLAAPLPLAWIADRVAMKLRSAGLNVTSTWIAAGLKSPVELRDKTAREDAQRANEADIRRSDVFVAITVAGVPRATYSEIGFALALRKPVIWFQGPDGFGGNLFDANPLVTIVQLEGKDQLETPYPEGIHVLSTAMAQTVCGLLADPSAGPRGEVWGYASTDDAERWVGHCATREEAIAEGCAAIAEGSPVWVVQGTWHHAGEAMSSAEFLLEWMPDNAEERDMGDWVVEAVDEARKNVPRHGRLELDALLEAWARKWCPIRAWSVTGKPEKVRE